MEIKKELLRRIPKIDEILAQPQAAQAMAQGKKAAVTQAARQAAEQLRSRILAGETPEISVEAAAALALEIAEENSRMNLRPVVNGTGVVLHTNLGRARMSHEAALAAMEAAESYNTLEYDCRQGRRGWHKLFCHCFIHNFFHSHQRLDVFTFDYSFIVRGNIQ